MQSRSENTNLFGTKSSKPANPNKKITGYLKVFFEVNTSYIPPPENTLIEDVPITKTQRDTAYIDLMSFDWNSNFETRDIKLVDIKDMDESRLLEFMQYADLTEMLNKSYMYDKSLPEALKVENIKRAEEGLVVVNPSFDTLKGFILKEYDEFI